MSDWRPLSRPFNGTQTDVLFDSSGQVVFRTQQECNPVLAVNKELRDSGDRGWCADGDMRRVASIPAVIIAEWLQEGIDVFNGEHQDRIARKLNDPDNFYLRTAPGRLGPVGDGTYR
jgi:hypothetical protein